MSKELVTEACVRSMRPGEKLVLGPGRIATPAALDLAFQRRIEVVYGTERAAAAPPKSGLLASLAARDGRYLVEVEGARVRVWRLSEGAPELVGEEGP